MVSRMRVRPILQSWPNQDNFQPRLHLGVMANAIKNDGVITPWFAEKPEKNRQRNK